MSEPNVPDLTPADLAHIMEAARVSNEQLAAERAERQEALTDWLVTTGLADLYVLWLAQRDYAYRELKGSKRPSRNSETFHQCDGRIRAFFDLLAVLQGTNGYELQEPLSKAREGRTAHDAAMALRARTNNRIG